MKHFAMAACFLAAGGWALAAEEFDVASVKQVDAALPPGAPDLSFLGKAGKPFKIAGNRVTVQGTLRALIADAYSVKTYQISGEPSWADDLPFTIVAESPGSAEPTQEQVRPMLQALLAERFQLKFHRETKELPVYHLIQTKKSAAFHAAGPDETFSWNLAKVTGTTLRSTATKESIGDFVELCGVSSDRPLIDKTGITGFIDYDILINQEGAKTPDDVNRAIVDAIKDQLGFKFEAARDKIDLLVIDRAAKASDN